MSREYITAITNDLSSSSNAYAARPYFDLTDTSEPTISASIDRQVLRYHNCKLLTRLLQKSHLIVEYPEVDVGQHMQVTALHSLHVILKGSYQVDCLQTFVVTD
jgi:hypothetical protein